MPNPKPKLENLKPFSRRSDRELGKVIGTRFPLEVQKALEQLDDQQQFIRESVEQRLKDEGLLPDDG